MLLVRRKETEYDILDEAITPVDGITSFVVLKSYQGHANVSPTAHKRWLPTP